MILKDESKSKEKWLKNRQKQLDDINAKIKNEPNRQKQLKLCSEKGFILSERPPESFIHSGYVY